MAKLKKKLTKTALKALANQTTLSIAEFNKHFVARGNGVTAGETFEVLDAQVRVNDKLLLSAGYRLKSTKYYNGFEIQKDTKEIKSFYRAKASAARIRAKLVK